jgi:hypothetical protein
VKLSECGNWILALKIQFPHSEEFTHRNGSKSQ